MICQEIVSETKVSNLDLDESSERDAASETSKDKEPIRSKQSHTNRVSRSHIIDTESESEDEGTYEINSSSERDTASDFEASTTEQSEAESSYYEETETETDRTLSHESITSETSFKFEKPGERSDELNRTFVVSPDKTPVDEKTENLVANYVPGRSTVLEKDKNETQDQNVDDKGTPTDIIVDQVSQKEKPSEDNVKIPKVSDGPRLALRLEGDWNKPNNKKQTESIQSDKQAPSMVTPNPRRANNSSATDRRQPKAPKDSSKAKVRDPSPFPTQKQTFTFDTSILKKQPQNQNNDRNNEARNIESKTVKENPRNKELTAQVKENPPLRKSKSEPPGNFKSTVEVPLKKHKSPKKVEQREPPAAPRNEIPEMKFPSTPKTLPALNIAPKSGHARNETERVKPKTQDKNQQMASSDKRSNKVNAAAFLSKTIQGEIEKERSTPTSVSEYSASECTSSNKSSSEDLLFFGTTPISASRKNSYEYPSGNVPTSPFDNANMIRRNSAESNQTGATSNYQQFYTPQSQMGSRASRKMSDRSLPEQTQAPTVPQSIPRTSSNESLPELYLSSPPPFSSSRKSSLRAFYSLGSSQVRSPKLAPPPKRSSEQPSRTVPTNQISYPPSNQNTGMNHPVVASPTAHGPVFAQTLSSGNRSSPMPRTRSMEAMPKLSPSSSGVGLDKYVEKLVKSRSSEPPNFARPPKAQSPIPVGLAHKQIRTVSPSQSTPEFTQSIQSIQRSESSSSIGYFHENKNFGSQSQFSNIGYGFTRFDRQNSQNPPPVSTRTVYNLGRQSLPNTAQLMRRPEEGNISRELNDVNPYQVTLPPAERQSYHNFSVSRNAMQNTQFRIQKDCIQFISPQDGRETTIHRNSSNAPVEIQIGNGGVNISFGSIDREMEGTELGSVYPMRRSVTSSRQSLTSNQSTTNQSYQIFTAPNDDYL